MQHNTSRISLKLIVGILLALSGCSNKYSTGTFLSKKEMQTIKECKEKSCPVNSIYSSLGFPVIEEDNRGYFVGANYSRIAFLRPKIVKSEIVEIITDENGKLKDFAKYEDIHNNNVAILPYKRYSHHDQISGLDKFLRNAGKFSSPRKRAKARNK